MVLPVKVSIDKVNGLAHTLDITPLGARLGAPPSVATAWSRPAWAWGDYDLDGHLDLFKTHFTDDANILTFA